MADAVGGQAEGRIGAEQLLVEVPAHCGKIDLRGVGVQRDGRLDHLLDEHPERLRRVHRQGEGCAEQQVVLPAQVDQLGTVEIGLDIQGLGGVTADGDHGHDEDPLVVVGAGARRNAPTGQPVLRSAPCNACQRCCSGEPWYSKLSWPGAML
ncbi:hypothetical protein D3C71_1815140 [compost metagenome]